MPKKILLADDSITIQKVVELTFSDGDYEVIATNNGARAIQKIGEVRPDIILSDIIMPEKNGYEVCEYVKSHPEFRRIPVILLTGTFEPFDPDRAEKAGCDAVVTKPFESQSLIHKVEELIQAASEAGAEPETATTRAVEPPPPPTAPAAPSWAPQQEWAAPPPPPPPAPEADVWSSEPEAASPFESAPPSWQTEPEAPAPFGGEQPSWSSSTQEEPFASQGAWTTPAETPFGNEPSPFAAPATPSYEEHDESVFRAGAPAEEEAPLPLEGLPPAGGETRAFPMMSAAEIERMQAAAAPPPAEPEPQFDESPSPFADEAPPTGGETLAFPQLSLEDISRLQQGSAPAAPPAWSPKEEEPAPWTDQPSGFTSAAPEPVSSFMEPQESPFGGTDTFSEEPPLSPEPPLDTWSPTAEAAPEAASPWETPAASAEPDWAQPAEGWQEPAEEAPGLQPVSEAEWPAPAPAEPEWAAPAEPEAPAAQEESVWAEPEAETESVWEEPAAPEPPAVTPFFQEPEPVEEPEPVAASEPQQEPAAAPAAAAFSGSLSDADVDRIARRVVELMANDTVRNIAWEVIPELAESIVRDRIRQLESE